MGVTDCFYVQKLLLYCQNCKIIMRYFIKCDNWTELLKEWENLAHCKIWALCTACEQKEIFPANCYERILMCLREREHRNFCAWGCWTCIFWRVEVLELVGHWWANCTSTAGAVKSSSGPAESPSHGITAVSLRWQECRCVHPEPPQQHKGKLGVQ